MKKHFITLCSLAFLFLPFLFSEENNGSIIFSTSKVNWITGEFVTELSLDTVAANLKMPTGKKSATTLMNHKMPVLIQAPLLSLYSDANQNIEDKIILEELALDDVYNFIMEGEVSTFTFTRDLKTFNTKKTLQLTDIGKYLVKHNQPYTPNIPINTVPSRSYSGIIIDARGANHVHGEYIESETYPCLFPTIWTEDMESVYERNLVEPSVIKEKGLVGYHYSDDIKDYEDRVGADPLYIKATEVYGRNRCDPIIKTKDALKILTIPENLELMSKNMSNSKPYIVDDFDIKHILDVASKHSMYSVEDKLKEGFLTYDKGIRIGVAGKGVYVDDKIKTIVDINSLIIRISHQIFGIADELLKTIYKNNILYNTLIISKPSCGKTTLIREIARKISNENIDTLVIDEKGEIAGSFDEKYAFDVGLCTDVISFVKKNDVYENAIRTCNPKVIIIDEIFSYKEFEELYKIAFCGVKLIVTRHISSDLDLKNDVCYEIIKKLFDYVVLLNSDKIGKIDKIIKVKNV